MPRRRTPQIPKTVWSQLGPLDVVLTTPVLLDDDNPRSQRLMGKYDGGTRRIFVDSSLSPLVQLQVCYHEATHAWLLDAGLRLGKLEEPVVDTISTALVAQFALRAT